MSEDKNDKHIEPQLDVELASIENKKKELIVQEELLLQKAIDSKNPAEIVKAMNVVKIKQNQGKSERKSTFIDPFQFDQSFGYKSSPNKLTYSTLFSMSKVPVINAIIKTRKTQVASFSSPQKDRHSTGFVIRKKGHIAEKETELSKEDRERIEELTEFILNTGSTQSWDRGDFDSFLRMFTEDTLIYDQSCFEIVRERGGALNEFIPVDGSTMRIADSFSDTDYNGDDRVSIGGYYPSYVQMMRDKVHAEYYPWELCFGVRNKTSRIYSNGYGRSELEDMVTLTTSMLWSDQYNRNFFRQGAAPKGILRIKGGTNNARVQEFRQQWKAMVAGVDNAWRTPVIDSESMEWIDLQRGHKDMEYGKWQEYLIKLGCAMYTIDPSEIGFTSGQASGANSQFEANNSQKIKYSKDKGLNPLLKFIATQINKYIVSQMYPDLIFEFVGLDAETETEYLAKVQQEVSNFKTINEVRKEAGLDSVEGGDIIANSAYMQGLQMKQQEEQMQQQDQGDEGDDEGDGGDEGQNEMDSAMQDLGGDVTEKGEEISPFTKQFNDMIDRLEKGEI